jgi:hypothetical protein
LLVAAAVVAILLLLLLLLLLQMLRPLRLSQCCLLAGRALLVE